MTKYSQAEIIPSKTDIGALGNRINAETKSIHDKLDKMVTVKFVLALRDYRIYRQGLQAFYHVFQAIEKALQREFDTRPNDEITLLLKQVWRPEIARTPKAETDLLFYYDKCKEKFVVPKMPEQIKFYNHILEVTQEKPYLLFAYMHVMYLALFAGGKVMRSSFARATGLFPQKNGLSHDEIIKLGSNFFNFDVEDDSELRIEYKREYELATRNNLSEEQKQDILDEAQYIFKQNANCIMELEQHNLARLKQKWGYRAITKGYYVVLTSFIFLVLFYLRRIVLNYLI
jgi:heme oxygenase